MVEDTSNNEPIKMMEDEHTKLSDEESLQDVYKTIFQAVKEISYHLRNHSSKFRTLRYFIRTRVRSIIFVLRPSFSTLRSTPSFYIRCSFSIFVLANQLQSENEFGDTQLDMDVQVDSMIYEFLK